MNWTESVRREIVRESTREKIMRKRYQESIIMKKRRLVESE